MLRRSLQGGRNFCRTYSSNPTQTTTLSNGVRVATQETPGQMATVGVWIDTGSVYETKANNGVAHFVEHMSFKGTEKRTQEDLEREVENKGMKLNAYTSREQTVYYSNCFKNDTGTAVEMLSDILTKAKFDKDLIEYERGVILREQEEVETMDDEVIMDHLHAVAFQGTSLGYTILGPQENISKLSQAQMKSYISDNYTGDRIVVSAAGAVDHDSLVKQVEKSFSSLPKSGKVNVSTLPKSIFTGSSVEIRYDDKPLVHAAFATESVGWSHPDYFVFSILQTMVGNWNRTDGTGKNSLSRLCETIAHEQLCHSVQSFHTPYHDTGLWGTYITSPADKVEDAAYETLNEWVRIGQQCREVDLARAVQKLKSQLLMQLDGSFAKAEEIGRQTLTLGRHMSTEEMFKRLDDITVSDVKRVAYERLNDCELAVACMGPIESFPDYNQLKGWTYWNRM